MENRNEYPSVEELSNGFSEYRLPASDAFAGKTIQLFDETGACREYVFTDSETLEVLIDGVKAKRNYSLVAPRDGIYMLDYIESEETAVSMTIVLDMTRGIATILKAQLPTRKEADVSLLVRAQENLPMTSVKAEYIHAAIDKPFTKETEVHPFTDELIGKRVRFQYSERDAYEHIYLNEKYYTWHCISGIEKGLCDTDRCYYVKLAEGLYWFTWLEKIVPTVGTVIEDLSPEVMRSFGKLVGYENYDHGGITNFQVGSYASE